MFLKRIPALAAAWLAASGLSACAQDDALKRGREIAEEFCVSCHAIDRDDTSKLKEAPPFRTLGKSYDVEALAEALAEGIVTGHEDMPEIALEPDDVSAFVDYLASIQMSR